MKKLLIIIDGMDDESIPALGNKTPRQFACMPALNYMREKGNVSFQSTIPPGNEPATDVAVLNILGYDVPSGFSSRSWLEALGAGIEVGDNALCLRCNLITHSSGILTSHCGDGITAGQCSEITELLNAHFGVDRLKFHGSGTFRNLLTVQGAKAHVNAVQPHTLMGESVSKLLVSSDDSDLAAILNRCIVESRALLSSYPANGIALWAPGHSTKISHKICGALITGVNVMRGIGRATGLSVVDVAGATADEHTDYSAKLRAALDAFNEHDFVLLHIEAPDEVSHKRDSLLKVMVLEEIDRKILAPLLKANINLEITIQSDHATSSISGKHLDCPVEVIKYTTKKQ